VFYPLPANSFALFFQKLLITKLLGLPELVPDRIGIFVSHF